MKFALKCTQSISLNPNTRAHNVIVIMSKSCDLREYHTLAAALSNSSAVDCEEAFMSSRKCIRLHAVPHFIMWKSLETYWNTRQGQLTCETSLMQEGWSKGFWLQDEAEPGSMISDWSASAGAW